MSKLIDLDGQRFGSLVATNKVKKIGGRTERLCYCDCGNETWALTTHLRTGHRVSCGCSPGMKLGSGESAHNEVLNSYKQRARYANLDWLLSNKEFDSLVTNNCYYCNAIPGNIKKPASGNGNFIYNGIDRINNKLGYITGNVVSCCQTCNRAKGQMTQKEFIDWAKRLVDHVNE